MIYRANLTVTFLTALIAILYGLDLLLSIYVQLVYNPLVNLQFRLDAFSRLSFFSGLTRFVDHFRTFLVLPIVKSQLFL